MLTLYGIGSPNVMKVVLMLEELGLPYDFRFIDVWAQQQFAPEFVAMNPNSKVPVLVDEPAGLTLSESGAILIYLAEKSGRFLPASAPQRQACFQWLMFQMASIGPMFGQATHFRRNAPPGNEYALSRFVTEVKRLADVLQSRLATSPYLAGEEYSIADMAAYPWISQYLDPNGIGLASVPVIADWIRRIEERPATRLVMRQWAEIRSATQELRSHGTSEGFDRLFGRGRYARA